jgi:hypothetical protein
MEMNMNEKVSSFLINSVLTVLLVGILALPAASAGLLGVNKGSQVLSAESHKETDETDPISEETSPSATIRYDR